MSVNPVPGPAAEKPSGAAVAGGGGPPYDADMDRRLTVLETRFDTIIPTLITKEEFYCETSKLGKEMVNLRVEMHELFNSCIKWMIGMILTVILSVVGTGVTLSNLIRSIHMPTPTVSATAPASAPAAPPPAPPR